MFFSITPLPPRQLLPGKLLIFSTMTPARTSYSVAELLKAFAKYCQLYD
jgi:hypothetical protein